MASEITKTMLRTIFAELMPKIADAAVKLTPEKARELFDDPHGFGRWALPVTMTGVSAGLTKILGRAVGNDEIGKEAMEVLDELRADFIAAYGEALRRAHGGVIEKVAPGTTDQVFPPNVAIIDPDSPTVYHHHDCPSLRRFTVEPAVQGSKDKPGRPEKRTPRTDLRSLRLAQAIRTQLSPSVCCEGLFFADAQLMCERAAAIAKASVPRPTEQKTSNSLQGYLGRAASGKLLVNEKGVKKLSELLAQLSAAELADLDRVINSDDEFLGLFADLTIEGLRRAIILAKDRETTSRLGEVLKTFGLPVSLARNVISTGGQWWDGVGKWAKEQGAQADERTARIKEGAAKKPPRPRRAPPVAPESRVLNWLRGKR